MTKRVGKRIRTAGSGSGKHGNFVMGRLAFSKVSAVEGIKVSAALGADLRALARVPAERRRSVLASKYGKR
jgi:hypothetical protein